jgi:hypothetical protein
MIWQDFKVKRLLAWQTNVELISDAMQKVI